MRPLMIVLLASAVSIAMAMTSTNQTQNISDIPNNFFQGFNLALGITVTPDALDTCEETYSFAVYFTGLFFMNEFANWDFDFALIHGIFGQSFEDILDEWKDTCEPVTDKYESYFQKAVSAYRENREAFWATVESNFKANEAVIIIEAGNGIASLIKAGNYSLAGYEFGRILEALLSQWLPTN